MKYVITFIYSSLVMGIVCIIINYIYSFVIISKKDNKTNTKNIELNIIKNNLIEIDKKLNITLKILEDINNKLKY